MEFRILGPLEVHSNGQALDLGGAKQRALLAVLLLHANQVVSQDRLVDALWEGDPPESAHKALQIYVSGLRKLLGKERLQTRPPGYLVCVEDDELDLGRFRRLRDEGRAADALALWRGPPLADFAYQHFAQAEIVRLEDQRLACVEERIDHELAAGRHAALTGELEALVAENPLRERLRGQLMVALYRAGRQAEALEAYQEARAALVDELGIEPGRELRELQQAILNQDPALELPPELAPPAKAEEYPAPRAEAPPRRTLQREVRKTVTALFVDVRILSAQNRSVDPEALRRVTGRTVDLVKGAVGQHGGVFETLAGTALTIVFGLPTVHEDDALRAVRAAIEVRDCLASVAAELKADRALELDFRMGIATGEVVAGGETETIGAIGEPLTHSARLAQAADFGAIVADDLTCRLLRDAIVTEPSHDGWQVIELAAQSALPSRRLSSPMVGRVRERRRMRDAFDQAVGDRSCQLFTVLGPAGVGKSRLVQEFLGDIVGGALVAHGRCLPYGEGITFWPLLEAVKEALGLDDAESPEAGRAKLIEVFAGADGADDAAQRVSETIGLAEAAPGIDEAFAAVRAFFEAVARPRPLVLVFDDIHWGESMFLDLVEYLADWLRDISILLICLARPELLEVRPGWGGGKLNATSILLEPLSEAESAELIENLAGAPLGDRTKQRIVEASEGNPLFVEEMLALALDDRETDRQLVVPPTIQALLAARLDRLGDDERAVLDVAAVQGKVFYEEAVVALLSPRPSTEVSSALGAAVHKELIRPDRPSLGGRTYRFRHLLIRDVAYESIPKQARSATHERFGRWLERAAAERLVEYEEIIGYHLEQAHRYRLELGVRIEGDNALGRAAAERLAAAGRRAFVRSDAPAGVNLISRAAALLPPDDPTRVELIPNVRAVQGVSRDMSWAERVLTEAVEASATTGNRALAAQALVQRGFLRLFTGPDATPDELVHTAERAILVFEELGDDLGLARAWRLVAQAKYLARNAGESEEAGERALHHARRAGDRFEERETIQWLSVVLFLGPKRADEAVERCESLLEGIAGEHSLEVHVLGALSYLVAIQGQIERAERLAAQARELMQELGEGWLFPAFAGLMALWEDDPAAAERELRPGYELLKRVGETSHFSTVVSLLARAAYAQGRYGEAYELTRECEEAARLNDVECQIHWRSTRAKVLGRRGEIDAAEALARAAVAFGEPSDFLSSHGDALIDLAEVLGMSGRRQEAAAHAEKALRLYEQKGNALAADRARSYLESVKQR
jgi:DNA-binding SARP family transcriptional activator/class 3 adenylate cyclase